MEVSVLSLVRTSHQKPGKMAAMHERLQSLVVPRYKDALPTVSTLTRTPLEGQQELSASIHSCTFSLTNYSEYSQKPCMHILSYLRPITTLPSPFHSPQPIMQVCFIPVITLCVGHNNCTCTSISLRLAPQGYAFT